MMRPLSTSASCMMTTILIALQLVLALQCIWVAAFAAHADGAQPHNDGIHETCSFQDGFSVIWGDVQQLDDDRDHKTVQLKLDQNSGSGFVSLENYKYAYFGASIKLPKDYTAGIVLAFYTSNGDDYPQTHDELDFEFLGNVKGKPWRLQTNIYGNGSVARGREERFNFWFDPTTSFHNYTILWNHKQVVFFVDDMPIRQMKQSEELGGDFPSKPMALYATMWDGSQWATNGGKDPVNYDYAPFFTQFRNFRLNGCATNPILEDDVEAKMTHCADNPAKATHLWDLTPAQTKSLKWVRTHQMYYSYCQDSARYATPLPECLEEDRVKLAKQDGGSRSHHSKHKTRAASRDPPS